MPLPARKLLSFAAACLTFVLAIGAAYPWVFPIHERCVVALAAPWLASSTPAMVAEVARDGALQVRVGSGRGLTQPLIEGRYIPHAILMSLVLFPAMILATPAPIRRRLLWLGIGLPLLTAIHTVALVSLLRSKLCLIAEPDAIACRWVSGLALTSGQFGAVLLWAALTWAFWMNLAPIPVSRRRGGRKS